MLDSLTNYNDCLTLAAKLRKFWADQGHIIETKIDINKVGPMTGRGRVIYCLRSNLLNGLPQ